MVKENEVKVDAIAIDVVAAVDNDNDIDAGDLLRHFLCWIRPFLVKHHFFSKQKQRRRRTMKESIWKRGNLDTPLNILYADLGKKDSRLSCASIDSFQTVPRYIGEFSGIFFGKAIMWLIMAMT